MLTALPLPHAHLEGTLLPRGFFLGLGLIYLAALAVDRLAARWRVPGAAAVLLLGLVIPTEWLTQAQPLGPLQVETLHRVSMALLIFYAGLKTDLRRIRGMTGAGLRLGCGGVVITVAITAMALILLAPGLAGGLPPAAAVLAVCCLGATDSGAIEDLLVALGHSIRGRLSHLLQFEVAVSTLVTLLGFGLVAGVLQAHPHGDHQALHALVANRLPDQLGAVGLHVIAGLLAGLIVGAVAPRLIDALVRSESMLLLVAVALAFVAFGFGQLLGGGGLLAVFVAGAVLRPGKLVCERRISALEAVMEAGGFDRTRADLTAVRIIRQERGQTRNLTVNLKRVLDGKDTDPVFLRRATTPARTSKRLSKLQCLFCV